MSSARLEVVPITLAEAQYQLRSGLRDLIAWNVNVPGSEIQALLDATKTSQLEGRLSPSAAPTNSVPSRSDSEGEGLAARIEELELSLKQADEELARVTKAAVTGPDGYLYHWCPGVGWCPGCPPVPKEEA